MKIETKCIHEGYKPENGQPRTLPIYQSTTYKYDNTEYVGKLFNLEVDDPIYSRFTNPTVSAVEEKISSLEGGIGGMCTSSGQMASYMSLINILNAGDHFISSSTIYGGTVNLFSVTMKKFGIEVTYVDPDANEDEINKAFKPNTKALFAESLANPAMNVLDVEKFAKIAHSNDVPLIIDNTFPTPYLLRPIEFGADVVIHSTTKYMDGHATVVGGVIIDSGNFNWDNGKFPELVEPDESYHGLSYINAFGKAAYIGKARVQLMRDLGAYPSAMNAFLLNHGLDTLALRMQRHSENAQKVAEFFNASDKIESVSYPGLKNNKYHELAKKYLPKGCSGVISVNIKGGKTKAAAFLDGLKLACNVVHVADIRTSVLHPASGTHRQLTDEQLKAAGVNPGMIRFSVGIENIDDIIDDIKQSLDKL